MLWCLQQGLHYMNKQLKASQQSNHYTEGPFPHSPISGPALGGGFGQATTQRAVFL